MKSLDQDHMKIVNNVMNLQLQRQNVIMGNLSNVNTPNYKPLEIEFEKELQNALKLDVKGKMATTSSEHLPSLYDNIMISGDFRRRFMPRKAHGEDRVNLDSELVKMTKNNLQYNALAQVTKSGYDGLNKIIAEGSKV